MVVPSWWSGESPATVYTISKNTLVGSRTLPHALVARAKLVLWAAQGKSNTEIAHRLHCTKATVGKWRQRFLQHRLAGLYDELRPGRPHSIEDDRVAALLNRTLSRKPTAGTHWTVRQAAQASGISKSTVHRLFQAFAVQPHRTRSFKLSTDPFFVEKVRDIVGLYLNPPDHALVLCVDEKSQIQALNRTQPVLPSHPTEGTQSSPKSKSPMKSGAVQIPAQNRSY